ncbi:MAG TPA: hypothetical protein VK634_17015 [Reyranella sp.]|nr:hypothetical protein [Reyranella sp.]
MSEPTPAQPPSVAADRGAIAVEAALADAERKGFRLAVLGRTAALVAIACFYFAAFPWPNNIVMAALFLAAAGVGLAPLTLVGSRFERAGRFAFFAVDMAAISAMLAFAPLSSGGDIPQNFMFFSGRHLFYTWSWHFRCSPCRRHSCCGPASAPSRDWPPPRPGSFPAWTAS